MKITRQEFGKKHCTLVFSGYAISSMKARGIVMEDMDKYLSAGTADCLEVLADIMSAMSAAGRAYETLQGVDPLPDIVTRDEVLACVDLEDMELLKTVISAMIIGDREVEADPPKKNEDAAPAEK